MYHFQRTENNYTTEDSKQLPHEGGPGETSIENPGFGHPPAVQIVGSPFQHNKNPYGKVSRNGVYLHTHIFIYTSCTSEIANKP